MRGGKSTCFSSLSVSLTVDAWLRIILLKWVTASDNSMPSLQDRSSRCLWDSDIPTWKHVDVLLGQQTDISIRSRLVHSQQSTSVKETQLTWAWEKQTHSEDPVRVAVRRKRHRCKNLLWCSSLYWLCNPQVERCLRSTWLYTKMISSTLIVHQAKNTCVHEKRIQQARIIYFDNSFDSMSIFSSNVISARLHPMVSSHANVSVCALAICANTEIGSIL